MKTQPCTKCKATGSVYVKLENIIKDCPECKGTGRIKATHNKKRR